VWSTMTTINHLFILILILVILSVTFYSGSQGVPNIESYANGSDSDQSPEGSIKKELKTDSKALFGVTKSGTLVYVDNLFANLNKFLNEREQQLVHIMQYIDQHGHNLLMINNMGGNPNMLKSIYNIDDINKLKKQIQNIKEFPAYHLDQFTQLSCMNIKLTLYYFYENKYGKTYAFPKDLSKVSQIISNYRELKTQLYSSMAYFNESMLTTPVQQSG
jgi:hypothetical protein